MPVVFLQSMLTKHRVAEMVISGDEVDVRKILEIVSNHKQIRLSTVWRWIDENTYQPSWVSDPQYVDVTPEFLYRTNWKGYRNMEDFRKGADEGVVRES